MYLFLLFVYDNNVNNDDKYDESSNIFINNL